MLDGFLIQYNNEFLSENKGFNTSCKLKTENKENGSTIDTTVYKSSTGDIEVSNIVVTHPKMSIKEKWVEIKNISSKEVKIKRVDSMHGILPSSKYNLKYFKSNAGMEFTQVNEALEGTKILEVTTGRSSKGMHPWFALSEEEGGILACSIAWSGNWIVRFEPIEEGKYDISGGLSNWNFSKLLKPQESMEGIHVVYTYLPKGDFDDACIEFGRWGKRFCYPHNELSDSLPVEWDHWWPYEDVDITEDIFKRNVDKCEELGVKVCMLDAGWFGEPDENCNSMDQGWSENVDWYVKRGDWHKINTKRFPSGIKALSDYVHSKGLKFAIWCEIEALGVKADLASIHPEYVARRDGEFLGYVCFGNPETVKWAFGVIETLINEYGADWIKIDFNLDPKAGCNRTDHGHGEGDGLYEHYMGYYKLLTMVRDKYPKVFIENCSSGGLRIDLGIAKHTHTAYLSDPDNTAHHLGVFWGVTTMLHPSACLHFTWSQNRVFYENNFDKDPIKEEMPKYKFDYIMRAGMLNRFSCSYRLTDLPEWCRERFKYHTAYYNNIAEEYIKDADMYHLTGQALDNGKGDRWNSFLYMKEDKKNALMFVFKLIGGETSRCIKLNGLESDVVYEVKFEDSDKYQINSGEELMTKGIKFDNMKEESSEIVMIHALNKFIK